MFSFSGFPQSNGQVETVNNTIKENLKKKLNKHKGGSIDNYPKLYVLIGY